MSDEIKKLQRAKMYISALARGMDPLTEQKITEDTLRNERIRACLRYVSDVLAMDIERWQAKNTSEFFITNDQIAHLEILSPDPKVSDIANEINRVTAINGTKKLTATMINDWLEKEGYLDRDRSKSRMASMKGADLGIVSEYRLREDGSEYYVNRFSPQAQRFIYDHLPQIVESKEKKAAASNEKIMDFISFPFSMSLQDFIQQQAKNCFIIATGTCDEATSIGSYKTALVYKGKSKLLQKDDIFATSNVESALAGILTAAKAIKMPVDLVIVSAASLGFNTNKNKNSKECLEICQILAEKKCKVAFTICPQKQDEINALIQSAAA